MVNNLTQALRWANGEIKVKDRNKRSFYLSAARSEMFNLLVSKRMELNLAQQILVGDVLQLNGSHSWFVVDESEDLAQLQQRFGTTRCFTHCATYRRRRKKCGRF